jgi:hypothetical protein
MHCLACSQKYGRQTYRRRVDILRGTSDGTPDTDLLKVRTPGGTTIQGHIESPGGTQYRHIESPGGTQYLKSPVGTRRSHNKLDDDSFQQNGKNISEKGASLTDPSNSLSPRGPKAAKHPKPQCLSVPKLNGIEGMTGQSLDPAFKRKRDSLLDPTTHVQSIERIQSMLPVTMMYEEAYRQELCEPGEVFDSLRHVERSVLGMKLDTLSRVVFALHLIKHSNFPYGICSYEISSNTVFFKILHGRSVHMLFRAKFHDIATEELEQLRDCVQVIKANDPEVRIITLRSTWEKVVNKVHSIRNDPSARQVASTQNFQCPSQNDCTDNSLGYQRGNYDDGPQAGTLSVDHLPNLFRDLSPPAKVFLAFLVALSHTSFSEYPLHRACRKVCSKNTN